MSFQSVRLDCRHTEARVDFTQCCEWREPYSCQQKCAKIRLAACLNVFKRVYTCSLAPVVARDHFIYQGGHASAQCKKMPSRSWLFHPLTNECKLRLKVCARHLPGGCCEHDTSPVAGWLRCRLLSTLLLHQNGFIANDDNDKRVKIAETKERCPISAESDRKRYPHFPFSFLAHDRKTKVWKPDKLLATIVPIINDGTVSCAGLEHHFQTITEHCKIR